MRCTYTGKLRSKIKITIKYSATLSSYKLHCEKVLYSELFSSINNGKKQIEPAGAGVYKVAFPSSPGVGVIESSCLERKSSS